MNMRWMTMVRRFGKVAVLGVALTGCSRIHVTRTINADGTLIDDYRFEYSEKGVGDQADLSGMKMTRDFEGILKTLQTGKIVVGEAAMHYKGEATYTTAAENAARSGVLYESGKWLTAQKAVWTKLPDGGYLYELPVDVRTLRPALMQGGIAVDTTQAAAPQPQVAAPDENPLDEPPPDPIFNPETPAAPANNPQMDAKMKAMMKDDADRLERAWKNLEVQVDIVMPGKVTQTNAKLFKDRTASWTIKPFELMAEMEKQKEGAAPLVLKVTCGAPLLAAKADEDRYKKLKTTSDDQR